ncbi:hypothetical protein ACTFIW_007633 [Dictyostelium discoideum]
MTIIEYNNNLEDYDPLLNESGYYFLYGFNNTIVYSIKFQEQQEQEQEQQYQAIFPRCSQISMIGIHKTLTVQDLQRNGSEMVVKLNDHKILTNEFLKESIEFLKKQLYSSPTTRPFYILSFTIINETEEIVEKSPILFFQVFSKDLDTSIPIDISETKKIETSLITEELKKSFNLVNIKTIKPCSLNIISNIFNNNNNNNNNNKNDNIYYRCENLGDSSTPIIFSSNSNNGSLEKKLNQFIKDNSKSSNNINNNLEISSTFEILFKITKSIDSLDSITTPILSLNLNDDEDGDDNNDDDIMISTLCLLSKNDSVLEGLNIIKQSIIQQVNNVNKIKNFKALHFQLPFLPFPITILFKKENKKENSPTQVNDNDNYEIRKKYHTLLGLPLNRPFLKSNLSLNLNNKLIKHQQQQQQQQQQTHHIKNIHNNISMESKTNGNIYLVEGSYDYYHYQQDNFDDSGWGCAYRSMQTICSWLRYQGLTNNSVPNHYEIQKTLVDIQDKEPSFLKSKQWIGAFEITLCLDHLFGIESKILNITTGSDIIYKSREIAKHFQCNGSPIMIGGGVLAYTLLGIDFNESTGETRYLILDPHYTGATDNIKLIKDKGWCGWKGPDLFRKDAFYNLCMPQIPNDL